ncbi:hypothetical protein F5B19DRAFT_461886 [Rostrohypoxylon terebratum]|nr:hypothetical protein F5B19DRAFT_461886 [Rostrohypoxylon terebratum]
MRNNIDPSAIKAFELFVRRRPPTETRAQPSLSSRTPEQNYVPPNPSDEREVSEREKLTPLERYHLSVKQENAEHRTFPLRYYAADEQKTWLNNKGSATFQDLLYKDADSPQPLSEEYKSAYEKAKKRPGSAEYLSTLLTTPELGCPHSPKLQCGVGTTIPPMLGFFHYIEPVAGNTSIDPNCDPVKAIENGEWYISRMRTGKLCEACFKLAAPNGFNTWSLTYSNMGKSWNLPPQVVAGQEQFHNGGVVPSERLIFSPGVERKGATYGFAAPEHGKGVFEFLKHLGDPFYIDLLHLEPPYDGDFRPAELENIRVNTMNIPAYLGARFIVAETDDGGKGISSSLEMRIAAAMGRLISCPKPDEIRSLYHGELPKNFDKFKLQTNPMCGMLTQKWPAYPKTKEELSQLNTLTPPSGMIVDRPLASFRLASKHRSYLESSAKLQRYEELLSIVEDWSCPPGYPHFFNLTIAGNVDYLQREVTRFDPINGIDELSPQEAYKTIRQALQFRRWRVRDELWFMMRKEATQDLNRYLVECGVPQEYMLDMDDPAGLREGMHD